MVAPAHSESRSYDALPVCLGRENPNRLVSLWWAMQHSDDGSRDAAIVTCYLDESGTDDPSPTAVVGGLLLNKSGFVAFDEEWASMLSSHSIPSPLHIKDFRRPDGRLADVSNEARKALFAEAVTIVNRYKRYSLAATITSELYRKYFDKEIRTQSLSIYGACFVLCAIMNHRLAEQNKYDARIPFLMDAGNQYAEHVRVAHATMQTDEWKHMNVGSLTFENDRACNALQAADVIAWASRQSVIGPFSNGYEPLANLFNEAHVQEPFSESEMAGLAARLDEIRRGRSAL